jgi:DNA polymerase III sliding clamp (beta) subunit (PCNA family)
MLMTNLFKQAVKCVSSLAQKNGQVFLKCVKVIQTKDEVTFSSTNLETFAQITLPVWSQCSGEFLIDAKAFQKSGRFIASKISKDKVWFGNAGFTNIDAGDFPGIPNLLNKKRVWSQENVDFEQLASIGKRFSNYVATDAQGRTSLFFICFRSGFAYATNGNVLLKEKHSLPIEKERTWLIPKDFFCTISQAFAAGTLGDIFTCYDGKTQEFIIAQSENAMVGSLLGPEDYPLVEKVIPKKFDTVLELSVQSFIEVLSGATNCMTSDNKNNLVTIGKSSSKGILEISSLSEGSSYKANCGARVMSLGKWSLTRVNARQLLRILIDCDSSKISMKLQSDSLAGVVFESESKSQLFMLMPFRISDDEKQGETSDESNNDSESKVAATSKKASQPNNKTKEATAVK